MFVTFAHFIEAIGISFTIGVITGFIGLMYIINQWGK